MMSGAGIVRFVGRLPWPAAALAVCVLFAVVGGAVVDDYGVSWDEFTQRDIAVANARYIAGDEHALLTGLHRYYGMAFELPLLWAEYVLGLDDSHSVLLARHLLTHLFYLAGGFFASMLAYRLFGSRWLALLALLLFLLHPRLYAHSFFNSKDLPALSMFMIALYLTHRAWRKDTIGAFVLCGVGAGVLLDLRLVGGATLFPAVLALRALDLAAPPRRPGHIMLTGGAFLLAGAGAMYVTTPYLWANPLELVDAFAVFSQLPNVGFNLFQGQMVRPQELPPHYLPTWMAITTPPGTLLLSAVGAAAVCYWAISRPGDILRSGRLRFGGLLLGCLAVPVVAVMVLDSALYDGWRHMYWLYAPLCLLAVFGVWWIAQWGIARRGRWLLVGAIGLAALGLGGIVAQMAQLHPHQDVYFNLLVDRKTPEYLRTQYEMSYWGTTTRQALEQLRERYPDTHGGFATHGENDWNNWSILPAAERQRIYPANFPFSDFYINFGREHVQTGRLWNPVGPIIASGQAYNNTIWSVEAIPRLHTDAGRSDWLGAYRAITAAAPAARRNFDLYRDGTKLHYVKEPCVPGDVAAAFFLHIYPADRPASGRQAGFDNRDFHFRFYGNLYDGKCLATIELPDYAIARISTGQYVGDQPPIWTAELPARTTDGPSADTSRAAWLRTYQSVTSAAPAARRNFDLYRDGNKLHYAKEPCVPADLAAAFLLHIYPVDPVQLTPEGRRFGFDNRDFAFDQNGSSYDGKCLATIELPDYAIARIRTGQYFPDQPPIWTAELPGGR